jgi:hypothetical protein
LPDPTGWGALPPTPPEVFAKQRRSAILPWSVMVRQNRLGGVCMFELDHIAVAGETLAGAVTYSEAALGVPLLPGGQHSHFATHNRLLGLQAGLYFEAISIDPAQPAPAFPRWFGLDEFRGAPRLDKWILRTVDIDAAQAAFPEAGEPVHLTRGALSWTMLVPPDGRLPFGGQFPAIIQWHTDTPPGQTLAKADLRLDRLLIEGPDAGRLEARLLPVFTDPRVQFSTAPERSLRAEFDAPGGQRVLT